MSHHGYPIPPIEYVDEKEHRRLLARSIHLLFNGKMNAAHDFTLKANVAATTLSDQRIGADSHMSIMPTSANASADFKDVYVSSIDNGYCVFTHPNNANADKPFTYLVIG